MPGFIRRMFSLAGRCVTSGQLFCAFLVVISIFTAVLIFTNLGSAGFWDDEATVGVLARNLVREGRFTGWDGRSLYMYRDGSILDAQLRPILPPLDIVVAASSFRMFGISTTSARLPFAVAGLCSLLITAAWMRIALRGDHVAALYGTALYGLLPALALNSRCCRYYAISMLAVSLMLLTYEIAVRQKKPHWLLGTSLAAVIAFYANPMTAVVAGLSLTPLLFFRDRRCLAVRGWMIVFAAALLFLAATLPYAILSRIWDRPDLLGDRNGFDIGQRLTLTYWHLRDLSGAMFLPAWLIALALWAVVIRRNQPGEMPLRWLGAIASVYVLGIAWVTPQSPTNTSVADVRYLTGMLPVYAAIAGAALSALHSKSRFAAIAIFAITVSTTLPAWPFSEAWRFRWLLPGMIHEISHSYPTVSTTVSRYLKKHAAFNDTIFAYPEYHSYPLYFYAGDHVRLAGMLTGKTRLPLATLMPLGLENVMLEQASPDWLVLVRSGHLAPQLVSYFTRPQRDKRVDYEVVAVESVFGEQTQRPELFWHSFGPIAGFDPRRDGVWILRKRSQE